MTDSEFDPDFLIINYVLQKRFEMNDDLIADARKYCDDQGITTHFEHGSKKLYPTEVMDAYIAGRHAADAELGELKEVLQNLFAQLNGAG